MSAISPCSVSMRSTVGNCFKAVRVHHQPNARQLCTASAVFGGVGRVMSGASQSYPQKVRIDEGKQKAAEVQSETAKTQGGENTPSDAGSKAKSAASQSQHVVNILTSDDPVSGADVSELAKAEAETNTSGRPEKGGPAAQAQSAATQLKKVADRKVADQDLINQQDAAEITAAEAKLQGGQTPKNSISSKAQSAADKAEQAGVASKA